MRGNTYIIIPVTAKGSKIPAKLANRLGWDEVEYDEEGKEIKRTKKHPTWEELGQRFKSQFGDIRRVNVGGEEFDIIELELSYIKGEVKEVLKLQKANKKDFLILNASEAKAWLNGEDIFA
ncbi:MAG: hypothetical protein D6698_08480 [Gammaproteobacteria bacterium]|nr:MAG: hypothetical protein D6698_08480 [Gammaproteobacteria bacterium]